MRKNLKFKAETLIHLGRRLGINTERYSKDMGFKKRIKSELSGKRIVLPS